MDDENVEATATSDVDLVLRTRSGDADAFGELWRRHYRSGMTVARSVTSSIDPDDLVQESYARIYQAILKGGGPNGSFRAYLFTSIRNTAAAWGRARRETPIDELESVADPATTEASAAEELDRGLTARAFRSLPSRWQEVLWYSEIEQMKPAAIGKLLGMSAGAVSQLTFRAREGLREAWIQAHLRSLSEGSECRWTIEHLGAYSRGNLAMRAQNRMEKHLAECARCMIVAAEAKEVSNRLALVLLPLVLGVSGAAAYLATLQGGGAPIVALAAMPSNVIEGAVVVTSGSGAVNTGPLDTGMSGAGETGAAVSGVAGGDAAGSASGAGALSNIGVLVGAGSAALILAGVVAAAAVVPTMLGGSPSTSQPSASDSGASSITSEVVPDSTMSTEDPLVIEVDETQPQPPDAPPSADVPVPPDLTEDAPPLSAPPAEQPAGDPDPAPGTDTGTTDPGTTDPGTTDPDETDPGETDPGETDPGAEPVELSWGSPVVLSIETDSLLHFQLPVSGAPGATVHAQVGSHEDWSDEIVLDADGIGTLELKTYLTDLVTLTPVTFDYVVDGVSSPPVSTYLSTLFPILPVAVATAPAE